MRNHVFRALTRVPGVTDRLLKRLWIPDARYATASSPPAATAPSVGRSRSRGWPTTKGATVRLDDVLGGQWAVLHTGAPPAGWSLANAGRPRSETGAARRGTSADAVVDSGGP